MQNTTVINFPGHSSEMQSFEEFWGKCRACSQISYQRAQQLFHASPEEYFARAGWVYVLGNQYLADDVFKIGRTTGRVERRMRQLFTTGVPGEFDCVYAGWFSDCHYAESYIHHWLRHYRLDENREFFHINLAIIRAAFMNCNAFAEPVPDHMVEQKRSRRADAQVRDVTVARLIAARKHAVEAPSA